jgi:putative cell wall-binding protein
MRPELRSPAMSPRSLTHGSGRVVQVAADVPTVQRWTMTVTPLCGSSPVYTARGRAVSRITTSWDLRDTGGDLVPPGVYRITLASTSPVGAARPFARDVEVLPAAGVDPSGCRTRRVGAADAVTTSIVAGRVAYPLSGTGHTVVIAGEASPHDALIAAPLAGTLSAPLLLSRGTALPAAVVGDLDARGVTRAYVVGGTSAVPGSVTAQLSGRGITVTRIVGRDRYVTAALVARRIGAPGGRALVASGLEEDLVYAVGAAAVGAATHRPILLVRPGSVPAAARSALDDLGVTSATVIGGSYAVSDGTMRDLARYGVSRRARAGGVDRYATAAAVAQRFAAVLGTDAVVASGWYRSGLSTAMAAGTLGRPVLLTRPEQTPDETLEWLADRRPDTVSVVATPGQVAVGLLRGLHGAAR